jgi:hypothetical protein
LRGFAGVEKQRIESARLKDDALAERPATDQNNGRGHIPVKKPVKSSQADVGIALREAFQAAVNEEVPDELLDLLRRLD